MNVYVPLMLKVSADNVYYLDLVLAVLRKLGAIEEIDYEKCFAQMEDFPNERYYLRRIEAL